MPGHSEYDATGPKWTELVSALSQAAQGTSDWRDLTRNVTRMLGKAGLDWKDLSRARDHVRTDFAASDAGATLLDAVIALSVNEAGGNASAEMIAACTSDQEPEEMLRQVKGILRNYVGFDVFSYGEYYHEGGDEKHASLIRGRFAMDGDDTFWWPARWIEVPPGLVKWVEGPHHVISNLDAFYSENPEAAGLKNHVVTQEYIRRGITSFVVVPRIDGGRVVATLTLGRRVDGNFEPFVESDQRYLDSFRLEPVLRLVGEAYERRTLNLAQDIAGLFRPEAEPSKLANDAVRRVGEGFELEYVGLFRVNRARQKFEVVAEYDPGGQLQVPEAHTQGLNEGMLGHVLREGRALYAPNVKIKPPPFDYMQTRPAQASAMCLPIRLRPDGNTEWILDLELSQLDAFPRPEQDALKRLVQEVERSVQLWFEARLCGVLLDLVDQGVVVLGEGTRIERANRAARRLLGLTKDDPLPLPPNHRYTNLEEFGADRASRAIICDGVASTDSADLRLLGPDGVERRALAGASYRDDAFNRRVWLLGDVEHASWVGSLHYMEMAVQTVMAQAHGSLLLARALLKRALAGIDANGESYLMVERALRSLTIADIPYERVACVYDVIAEPRRGKGILDLGAELLRFHKALPTKEGRALHVELPDSPVVVRGDPERLSFAFRSLLGHLLYLSLPDDQVEVCLTIRGGAAMVEVVLHRAKPGAVLSACETDEQEVNAATRDRIACAERRAYSVAAHALDAVRAVIVAHGGELRRSTDSAGELRFTISRLELATASAKRRPSRSTWPASG